MLKSRRGYLAAGLAVAVVGALGVASTLTAGAEELPADTPTAAVEAAGPGAAPGPPPVLPWGAPPAPISEGSPGATSQTLRADGFAVAAADTSGATQPSPEYAPKGRSANGSVLRSEVTDVAPPGPPPPVTATDNSIAPSAATEPAAPEPAAPEPAAPEPAAPVPSASVATSSQVNYLYNVGSQLAETDGIYANVLIGRPTLATTDYHTLAELALQSADGRQIVEVGWTVDRVVNGDDDPHLFVYRWVNRVPSCYNACGFVQYSSNVKPGDTLTNGLAKRFGIQYFNGAWWIAFDSEWVGYFPERLWLDQGVSFNRSGLIQTFGEVASTSTRPCTQMGNGLSALNISSALLGSVSYLNGPTVSLNVRSTTDLYPVSQLTARTFRYGGPGAC